ncbi:MAG: NAD-dependent epimerase/dehydratase family protein, partial [Gammaproteobacteria bacterium]|nr:NAD-dependent epimerase/dehydratase family protein [Gammaproteobacteria bacterium]
GAALSRRLLADGVRVIGVDDLSTGKVENVPLEVEFIEGDVADQRVIHQLPSGVSTVFHLAGQSSGEISFDDPVGDLHRNVVTTLRLIEWCADHEAPRLVLASSMSLQRFVVAAYLVRPVRFVMASAAPLRCLSRVFALC